MLPDMSMIVRNIFRRILSLRPDRDRSNRSRSRSLSNSNSNSVEVAAFNINEFLSFEQERMETMVALKKVTVHGLTEKEGFCYEKNYFRAYLGQLGLDNNYMNLFLEIIGPEHVDVDHQVEDGGKVVNFSYKVNHAGAYIFEMKYMGVPIPKSPFFITVKKRDIDDILRDPEIAAKTIVAHGRGLKKATLGETASFKLNTSTVSKTGDGPVLIFIDLPDGTTVSPLSFTPSACGAKVEYISTQVGLLVIRVLWDGVPISGSPFFVHCTKIPASYRNYRSDFTLYQLKEESTLEEKEGGSSPGAPKPKK